MAKFPDNPFDNGDSFGSTPDDDRDDFDILSRLREKEAEHPRRFRQAGEAATEPEPDEDFWAVFSMITHTGERFELRVCFSGREHYNTQMHRLETAKNTHVVLKDANDESVVIKRDMLLHVLPSGQGETDGRSW